MFDEMSRSHWVRLRTLIVLRWIAIAGQLAAIETARHYFDIELPVGLCYLAVGVAIMANLVAILVYPENKRLSEAETTLTLMFDVAQLSFLLFLTGGMNNPFAVMILTPVTVAASALRLRSAAILGATAVALVSVLAVSYIPLRSASGDVLEMPEIFRFGFWMAIVIGVAFLALYARRVSMEINSMSDALLATQLALAREQKLTDLGGVVAAAAHELGTPLATIKLVSTELIDELDGQETLREDAELIRDQADHCRDILRSMGRAGKDDLHMRQAPLDSVIREAAEPHRDRGKDIRFDVAPEAGADARQPQIWRRPEVIHGLRNLVQNAVDFSSTTVWVDARWTDETVSIRIADDGDGFSTTVLGRIGDPFMRARKSAAERGKRPEYEGMGLGLFIAKTLLERSGAELSFANGADLFATPGDRADRSGALVEVMWPRARIAAETPEGSRPLGQNRPIRVG
ncbi:MAG: ActS/PrrB/RegB family redox-sensitive histidine kinase [Paracoccaceae bacterium]|jgi:two-component system sensor histidine kinase RegB|nr:ActS/PrrB/RegB family redox-sensitive histidine kinase [Paracoccaceae bacterium]